MSDNLAPDFKELDPEALKPEDLNPEALNSEALKPNTPDYKVLAGFLLEPILEQREALRINCETNSSGTRTWLRVAFDPQDKGRVLGKNGRTIQSVRNVLALAAKFVGQSVHLEVYDSAPEQINSGYGFEDTDGNTNIERNQPSDHAREPIDPPRRYKQSDPGASPVASDEASGEILDRPSKAIKLRENKDKQPKLKG
jgi:uncharacterized protein